MFLSTHVEREMLLLRMKKFDRKIIKAFQKLFFASS